MILKINFEPLQNETKDA